MIRKAVPEDCTAVAGLALLLWPGHTLSELEGEFAQLLTQPEAAVFLALEDGTPIGFAQCQLRRDYVEGTGSSPVGYLEGIFVREDHRRLGIARKLLAACETWAKAMGCREFASDCELDNRESLKFHLNLGFTEANRIICFTKTLSSEEKRRSP